MNWNKVQTLIKDIRFWIVLLFVLRLVGITNPPLEVSHNWRQTTVTMVARNFYEVDNNILYPRIDIAGELSGITGMEFPLLNYTIYLVSEVFGYQHWYGRLINLLITSLGLFFFYKVIKELISHDLAFWATLLLSSSIWYAYGRKIMPDTFAVSLAFISIYFGLSFLKESKQSTKNYLLFGFFLCLSVLAKLPAIVVFALLIPPIFNVEITRNKKTLIITLAILCILPALWWYFKWVPFLVEKFGFWHFFMGKTISRGIIEILDDWNLVAENFYSNAIGISGFILFILGSYYLVKNPNKSVTFSLLGGSLLFLIIMLKAGWTFAHHSYYMIPFVPFMALIAAYFLTYLKTYLKWMLFGLVFIECVINAAPHFNIKKSYAPIASLKTQLQPYIMEDELIVINSGNNPTPMYFAHKRGWVIYNSKLAKKDFQAEIINKGCKYALILKQAFGSNINLPFRVEIETEDFKLYNLQKPTP